MSCIIFAIAMMLVISAVSEHQGSSHVPAAFPTQFPADISRTRTTAGDSTGRVQVTANSTADWHMRTRELVQFADLDVHWISDNKVLVQVPDMKERIETFEGTKLTGVKTTVLTMPGHNKVFITDKHPECTHPRGIKLYVSNNSDFPSVWSFNRWSLTLIAENINITVPDIMIPYCGFCLELSFHKVSDPMLHQLPNGQWNCSVPYWQEFDVHFRCNLKIDCEGGEDEVDCPYTGRCGLGRATINNRCYE